MDNSLSILQNITSLIKLREMSLENREYQNALIIRNELKKFSVFICNDNKYWVESKSGTRILWEDYNKMALVVKTTTEKTFNQVTQFHESPVLSPRELFFNKVQVAEFAF